MRLWRLWLVARLLSTAFELDEEEALIPYEPPEGLEALCQAPPGPVLVKDVVREVGHDVSEEVIARTLEALEAEGVAPQMKR